MSFIKRLFLILLLFTIITFTNAFFLNSISCNSSSLLQLLGTAASSSITSNILRNSHSKNQQQEHDALEQNSSLAFNTNIQKDNSSNTNNDETNKSMHNLRNISQLRGSNSQLFTKVLSQTIPPLTSQSHKGSSGRIGILGGSEKYTGAPYYAAMSALRTGADLATIFCAQEACVAIKSYSPELMVHGVYSACKMQSVEESVREEETRRMVTSVVDSLGGLHVLVIGPGLGRDPAVLDATAMIMERARDKRVGLVLDADALYLLSLEKYHYLFVGKNQDNDKVQSARGICVLTPNVVEYKRLLDSVAKGSEELFQKLLRPGIVMVRKGHHDVIESFDGDHSNQKEGSSTIMICEEKGGLKRSGGIGDILSGSIGTFVAWNRILQDKQVEHDVLLSCWMATCLTKRATRVAFEKRRRSMTAPDVLEEIGTVVDEVASSTIVEEDIHVNYSAQNKQF